MNYGNNRIKCTQWSVLVRAAISVVWIEETGSARDGLGEARGPDRVDRAWGEGFPNRRCTRWRGPTSNFVDTRTTQQLAIHITPTTRDYDFLLSCQLNRSLQSLSR